MRAYQIQSTSSMARMILRVLAPRKATMSMMRMTLGKLMSALLTRLKI